MSIEENKAIVERLDAALWDHEHGLDILREIRHPDRVMHFPEGWPPRRQARDTSRADRAAAANGAFVIAFPDMHQIPDETMIVAEGDFVVRRTTNEGTHLGLYIDALFGTFPPTGKKVRWNAVNIYRIEAGKIVENWAHVDYVGLVRQLGWRGPGEDADIDEQSLAGAVDDERGGKMGKRRGA